MEKRRDKKGRVLRTGEVQRKDGRYMYRYTDASGERKTIYSWRLVNTDPIPAGKKDGGALRDLDRKIERDLEDGLIRCEAKLSIDKIIQIYIESKKEIRPATIMKYKTLYKYHMKDRIGGIPVSGLKTSKIKSSYVSIIVDDKIGFGTLIMIDLILMQMLEMAKKDNMIRTNPAAGVLTEVRKTKLGRTKTRDALSIDEQRRFIDFVYGTKRFARWGAMFTVLLGTGMRIGEAAGLTWSDCDFEAEVINVSRSLSYGKTSETGRSGFSIDVTKTESGERVIPMLSDVKKALLRERERNNAVKCGYQIDGISDFVFLTNKGRPFTESGVDRSIKCIVAAYNRKEEATAKEEGREPNLLPRISPHIFRHTFCTRLCENTDNIKMVQGVMGHKSSKTTLDVYAHVKADVAMEGFKKLDGLFKLA